MKLEARPYRDARDLVPMRRLLVKGTQSGILASYMHPGSLDWDTQYPPDEDENRRNLLLWERLDEGEPALAAWAMLSRHEGTFDVFVAPAIYDTPAHEAVMDEYVAWATARAREAEIHRISPFWMFDYDTVAQRLMRERGFIAVEANPPPLFERSLDMLPPLMLPEGFTVQGVDSLEDGQLRAQVTYGAFRPNDDWEAYWSNYARFIGSAGYDGARDLFIRSPDGRGASACTIWFDEVNAVGLFEPVATHPDFQGRGLGKAVMAEGMRRMREAGMRRAILGFDPDNAPARALYTSLGFRASCYFALYELRI